MNVFKIEKMNRGQLLQICKIMNIKASKKHTKAQLITKLLKPLGRKYMMKKKVVVPVVAGAIAGGLLKALPIPKRSDVACAVVNEDNPLYKNSVKLSTDDFPECDPDYHAFITIGKTGKPNDGQRLHFKPSKKEGVSYEISDDWIYTERQCGKKSCKQTKEWKLKTDEQIKKDIEDAQKYVKDSINIIDDEEAQNVWDNLP